VTRTIGIAHEFIRIDNEANSLGICAAYNRGMLLAQGDLLLFVHEDVLFITPAWGLVLADAFRNPDVVGVGIAGSAILAKDNSWFRAGQPHIHGHVIHPQDEWQDREVYFAPNEETAEVVVLDGVFIAVRAEDARALRFDEERFPKFDLYDADFTLRLAQRGTLLAVPKILLKHFSRRDFDQDYFTHNAFQEKHGALLPYKLRPDLRESADARYFQRLIPRITFPEEEP
jgi:glycosyltransferase involved in cell wall biosynthesis